MCTPNQMSLEVESLPALADSFPPLRQIDLEHVQASPIPLHSGAARFYRERELFQ